MDGLLSEHVSNLCLALVCTEIFTRRRYVYCFFQNPLWACSQKLVGFSGVPQLPKCGRPHGNMSEEAQTNPLDSGRGWFHHCSSDCGIAHMVQIGGVRSRCFHPTEGMHNLCPERVISNPRSRLKV